MAKKFEPYKANQNEDSDIFGGVAPAPQNQFADPEIFLQAPTGTPPAQAPPVDSEPLAAKLFVEGENGPAAVDINPADSSKPNLLKDMSVARNMGGTIVRGLLEGAGSIGGGMLGLRRGNPIAGGAVGFGLGSKLSDVLLQENQKVENTPVFDASGKPVLAARSYRDKTAPEQGMDMLKTLAMGYTMEAAPVIGSNAVKGAMGILPKISQKAVSRTAGEVLQEMQPTGVDFINNTQNARLLEREVPGLNFTPAQASGQPSAVRLQAAAAQGSRGANDILATGDANQREALRQYLDSHFAGGGTIEDVLAMAQQSGANSSAGAQTAAQSLDNALIGMSGQSLAPQEAGRGIRSMVQTAQAPEKAAVTQMYDSLPETAMPHSNTFGVMQAQSSAPIYIKDEPAIKGLHKYINDTTKQFGESFQTGIAIDKTLSGAKNEAAMAGNSNLARMIGELQDGIRADIQTLDASGPGVQYAATRKAYADYANKYKSGAVDDVLAKGNETEGFRVVAENVPKNFLSASGADSLISVLGVGKAKTAIKPHLLDDFLQYTGSNPTPQKMANWVAKNRDALNKYGLAQEFNSVQKLSANLEAAKAGAEGFNKTYLAKMLKVDDPAKAINAAFSNSQNATVAAKELMAAVGHDKKAVEGLQAGFKDWFVDRISNASRDVKGANILSDAKVQSIVKEYNGAMGVIYANAPEKLRALKTVHGVLETITRGNIKVPGGNSATAMNTLDQGSMANKIIMGVLGVVGGGGGAYLGGGMGATAGVVLPAAFKGTSMAYSHLTEVARNKVNTLVLEAAFNPQLAQSLINVANKSKQTNPAARRATILSEQAIRRAWNNRNKEKTNE